MAASQALSSRLEVVQRRLAAPSVVLALGQAYGPAPYPAARIALALMVHLLVGVGGQRSVWVPELGLTRTIRLTSLAGLS